MATKNQPVREVRLGRIKAVIWGRNCKLVIVKCKLKKGDCSLRHLHDDLGWATRVDRESATVRRHRRR